MTHELAKFLRVTIDEEGWPATSEAIPARALGMMTGRLQGSGGTTGLAARNECEAADESAMSDASGYESGCDTSGMEGKESAERVAKTHTGAN